MILLNRNKSDEHNDESNDGRRLSQSRLRLLVNIAIIPVIVFIGSLVIFGALQAGYLDLRVIEVSGNSYLTDDEVRAISELESGESLFSNNPKDIRENLESDPRIKNVKVRRQLPDKIILEIEERYPVAVIQIDGTLYKVAADGFVISRLDGQYEDLPFVCGIKTAPMNGKSPEGMRLGGDEIKTGLAIAGIIATDERILASVETIKVDRHRFYLNGSREVVIYDDNFDSKRVERLGRVLEVLDESGSPYEIDMRFGDDVIVRSL